MSHKNRLITGKDKTNISGTEYVANRVKSKIVRDTKDEKSYNYKLIILKSSSFLILYSSKIFYLLACP